MLASPAFAQSAQTWFTVPVTAAKNLWIIIPVGTVYRIGGGPSITATKKAFVWTWEPDRNKEYAMPIDILETSTAQTVVVSDPGAYGAPPSEKPLIVPKAAK